MYERGLLMFIYHEVNGVIYKKRPDALAAKGVDVEEREVIKTVGDKNKEGKKEEDKDKG